MKMLNKTLLILMAVVAVSFTSCKSDDDGGSGGSGKLGTFTAKVDGRNFKGMKEAVMANESGTGQHTVMILNGSSMNSDAITISLVGFDGEGTYVLSGSNTGMYTHIPNPSNPMDVVFYNTLQGGQGEVKVSHYDGDTIKGTFHFTASNTENSADKVNITDGNFNIKVEQH